MDDSELYTEKLMNIILDAIDDIIIIHDSEHTVIWMNRAAENAFGVKSEEVIGKPCYTLFNNRVPCQDCTVTNCVGPGPSMTMRRTIPRTGLSYDCTTIPYYEKSVLKLVVQLLKPVKQTNH